MFGAPTRFGNVAARLKAFLDGAGGLWLTGKLADNVYTAFTSAQNPHGGQESTLLALYSSIYHFGGYIVTPGHTDPSVFASGGNPYGVSVTATGDGPTDADLAHARYLGKRVAELAQKLARQHGVQRGAAVLRPAPELAALVVRVSSPARHRLPPDGWSGSSACFRKGSERGMRRTLRGAPNFVKPVRPRGPAVILCGRCGASVSTCARGSSWRWTSSPGPGTG